jgi:pyruvate dehydrogenase E2 component (dihydrolipoamide acetyltransferase)
MAVEIVMPRMGLTMESGTVVAWLKAEGEIVASGEPLLEIETDKTTVEIESPGDGLLGGIQAQPGDTVAVGTVIGYLLEEGESLPTEPVDGVAESSGEVQGPPALSVSVLTTPQETMSAGRIKASPAARHLARSLDVDLSSLEGTGPGGRVVAWNVRSVAVDRVGAAVAVKASPMASSVARDLGVDLTQVTGTGVGGRITREDVERSAQRVDAAEDSQELPRIHQIMAERMSASFSTVPHFYLSAEADARPLTALRQTLLPKVEERQGVRVTLTDLLIKMCSLVLADHREMIAQWEDGRLRMPSNVSVGVAVDSPGGLVVPVIRGADKLNVGDIARERARVVAQARNGRLEPRDLEGGTFTISNLGLFRVDSFQAIINSPQAAILAVGQVKQRPFVENGEIIAAETVFLTLSVDHRVVDGATAARFFSELVEYVEMPELAI